MKKTYYCILIFFSLISSNNLFSQTSDSCLILVKKRIEKKYIDFILDSRFANKYFNRTDAFYCSGFISISLIIKDSVYYDVYGDVKNLNDNSVNDSTSIYYMSRDFINTIRSELMNLNNCMNIKLPVVIPFVVSHLENGASISSNAIKKISKNKGVVDLPSGQYLILQPLVIHSKPIYD